MTSAKSTITYQARGRCHCNSTLFEFHSEVLTCFACHCIDCQASNGSAFTLNLMVPAKSLQLVYGELGTFNYNHQNRPLELHCCKQCASVLWLIFADCDEWASVQLGTLLDQTLFTPIAHIWTSRSVDWLQFNDQIPCFDTEPDFEELINLWRKQEAKKRGN